MIVEIGFVVDYVYVANCGMMVARTGSPDTCVFALQTEEIAFSVLRL